MGLLEGRPGKRRAKNSGVTPMDQNGAERITRASPLQQSQMTQAIPTILPVILCGGSGTRLWPLSRKALPKQFVPLIDGRSLLSLTLERVAPLASGSAPVVCVGAEDHRFLLREAISDAGMA